MSTATHGSKTGVLVNGYDLSPFLNTLDQHDMVDALDATCFGPLGSPVIDKEYIAGLGDATLDAAGKYVIDHAAGAPNQDQLADVLESVLRPTTKPLVTTFPFGDGFGNSCQGYVANETSYGIDNSLTAIVSVSTKFQASGGTDPMSVLHPLATEASPGTNGPDLDAGVAYSTAAWKGAVAYLHVLAVSGATPSITCKVQHSSDGVTWVDLLTFAAITAKHKALRVSTLGTVNRHLRALWTISAGATVTFHLSAGRIPA